jgi:hypothetical protein
MPHKHQLTRSPEAAASRVARAREVRDLYDKLRRKYRQSVVEKFFRDNYFIQPRTVEVIIRESDDKPVDTEVASIIYRIAMQDNFHL